MGQEFHDSESRRPAIYGNCDSRADPRIFQGAIYFLAGPIWIAKEAKQMLSVPFVGRRGDVEPALGLGCVPTAKLPLRVNLIRRLPLARTRMLVLKITLGGRFDRFLAVERSRDAEAA